MPKVETILFIGKNLVKLQVGRRPKIRFALNISILYSLVWPAPVFLRRPRSGIWPVAPCHPAGRFLGVPAALPNSASACSKHFLRKPSSRHLTTFFLVSRFVRAAAELLDGAPGRRGRTLLTFSTGLAERRRDWSSIRAYRAIHLTPDLSWSDVLGSAPSL